MAVTRRRSATPRTGAMKRRPPTRCPATRPGQAAGESTVPVVDQPVDDQGLPGDVRGSGARKVRDQCGDLVGPADAAEGAWPR